jgi:hypothetical protein
MVWSYHWLHVKVFILSECYSKCKYGAKLQNFVGFDFSVETKCLKEKSAAVLHKYYECKNHQKKQIQTGG